MRRILIFSLAYAPHWGGAEIAIKEITDRISPEDIEFHLVTLRMDRRLPRYEQIGNVHVHRIGRGSSILSKFWYQLLAPWHASRLDRIYRFYGVWAMMAHSAGVPAALFHFFYPHIPYALTLQEGDPPEEIEATMRPIWPLFSRAFKRAAVISVISQFLGSWARRRGFEGPLEIIPNGVDGRLFSREVPLRETQEMRIRYGFSDADRVMVTASRLVPKNGIDLVIRALPLLAPNIKFLVLGDGSQKDELQLLAAELGVERRVALAGEIAHDELPRYLHASDLFVRPSRSEGQGIAFIEAMAAGIPVVATQVGGISDFLFDESRDPGHEATGFAADPDSPESIAETVARVIEDPLRARQIAIHAQRIVLRDYDWDTIAGHMRERVFAKTLP